MSTGEWGGRASVHYDMGRDVHDAALERMRWIFGEFDGDVAVSFSGGKDSTTVMELALIVARERDELPLKVFWLDQECEFQATRDYCREVADRPEIDFRWYQVPFNLFNATNSADEWLRVWDETPGIEWAREKEPDSIHENTYFTKSGKRIDRFGDLLKAITEEIAPAVLDGLRAEESPRRHMSLVNDRGAYKYVTWGKRAAGDRTVRFHPIYDWTYRDVWKAMNEYGWSYNSHYETQFRHGVPVRDMRVSNYHHETALAALAYLQEAEPETWERATRRLEGLKTQAQIGGEKRIDLPYMFTDWTDYLAHLIATLVAEDNRATYVKQYEHALKVLPNMSEQFVAKEIVRSVLANDLYGTKIKNVIATKRIGKTRTHD